MDKTASSRQHRGPSKRRLIQLYSALLHNANIRGFIDGEIYQGKAKAACVPGLNCYSCPGAVGACPLGALQNALGASGHRAGWYILGILMLFGLIPGRTVCGWLCPFGLLQELLYKVPTLKIRKNRITGVLSCCKYAILAVFVVAMPLWYGLRHDLTVPGFCKYICPAGTFEGAVSLLAHPDNTNYFAMLGGIFTNKWIILVILCTACIFCFRAFCRFLCPLGAIYGMFNRLALVGVKVDADRCNGCGACVRKCRMDVRRLGDCECINCAECMNVCQQNALSLRAGNRVLLAPAGGRRSDLPDPTGKRRSPGKIAWGASLAILCMALLWFNLLAPAVTPSGASADTSNDAAVSAGNGEAAVGTSVGDRMEDFTVEMLDGSAFHLADCRGKVVVINMWATYCGPCVREMPVFEDFQKSHAEDAVVLIAHASDPLEDVPAFMEKNNITLPCTIDTEDDRLFQLCGASPSVLPHTVILNRDGVIIYDQAGSMTADLLGELYDIA